MDLVGTIAADLAENFIKGAVHKAVQGFLAKGEITAAQAPVLEQGVMIEVRLGLELWQASQRKGRS